MSPITHPGERGPMSELQIVRLADEGVPIKALVRVFRKPFGDVERLLKEAVDRGEIVELPAADWPSDTRRDTRLPTIAAARGGAPSDFIHAVRAAFRMTHCEAIVLSALVWRGRVSKAALHEEVANEAAPKIVDVFVCKVRKKLAPFGFEIETVWGWGYALPDQHRAAIVAWLRETVVSPAQISELVMNDVADA